MKFFQKPLILALGAILVFSCSKDSLQDIQPFKPPVPAFISNVADFKMILPKGNQIVADGVDMLNYKFLFLDKEGNEITGHDYYEFFSRVTVKGDNDVLFTNAIKSNQLGTYDISISVNGITKSYPVVATTAEKKIVEIPIIFNFVSTDYSDKAVELTFTNLVNTYKRAGVDNVVFKLAEIDNDGKPLKRKGVKFWDYKGVATDLMDFKALWGNKFAFNVYLIDNKAVPGASAYASSSSDGKYIVIDNAIEKWQKEHLESDGNTDKVGLFVLIHEMGHILGLSHVYREDNNCQVQDGVNDIQAINFKTSKVVLKNNITTWTTNCGGKIEGGNIMMGAGATSVFDFWASKDQAKVVQKTALTLKF